MSILKVQFPKDFNEKYQEYRQMLLDTLKEKELPKIEEILVKQEIAKEMESLKPHTITEGKIGYFKFYKEGKKIKIGGLATRPFNFLRCLCNPHFRVERNIEDIFESIKIKKDLKDPIITGFDSPQKKRKILDIIEFSCIKELQKIKELKKLKYNFNEQKTRMWLSLEE